MSEPSTSLADLPKCDKIGLVLSREVGEHIFVVPRNDPDYQDHQIDIEFLGERTNTARVGISYPAGCYAAYSEEELRAAEDSGRLDADLEIDSIGRKRELLEESTLEMSGVVVLYP